ncbi:MAG: hypothetical protein Kow00124_31760 [Anaerolineae bacterium]
MDDFDLYNLLLDLNSADQGVREAAYSTLIGLGEAVVPHLLSEYDRIAGGARISVIRALGEIGDARAVPLLLETMRDRAPDSYFMLPSLAANALGQIGGEEAVRGLVGHLSDANPGVRRMAARVLGRFSGEQADRAVDGLRGALADHDEKVRAIAAESLQRIGTPGAIAALDSGNHRH